jgi:hypothetical protein
LTLGAGRPYHGAETIRRRWAAKGGEIMRVRQFAIASGLSLAVFATVESSALAQQAEAMKYCKADVARLCPGVQMGGGRIIACLKEHKMEVGVGCAKALQAMKGKMGQ